MQEQPQQPPPSFVGVADLATRWNYTRQGVHKLSASTEFPPPAFTLNAGRTRAWRLSEIMAYEVGRPELGNPAQKQRKIVGYLRAVTKAPKPPQEGQQP